MVTKRLYIILALVTVVLLLLPACGGGGDDKTTPASTGTIDSGTPNPTTTSSATSTPGASGPVKIGAITSWSGPAAMSGLNYADPAIKLVEHQVEDMGGILGGRMVKIVKYDNHLSVAEAVAGVTKLIKSDKVSAIVFGGVSGAECVAVAEIAEKEKVLYAALASVEGLNTMKYTVQSYASLPGWVDNLSDVAIKVVKAKKVAFLWKEYSVGHVLVSMIKERLDSAGVSVVYEQYVGSDLQDFSAYLTKIKKVDPDVVISQLETEQCITVAKQITELGGWGDIKVDIMENGLFARKMPGAEGWYILVSWVPGLEYPGAQKFEKDYQAMYGRLPDGNNAIFYNNLWTAIEAIKLAGTDDQLAVAQVARSGNLEFDSVMGRAHFNTAGESGLKNSVVQVQKGGAIVSVKWG